MCVSGPCSVRLSDVWIYGLALHCMHCRPKFEFQAFLLVSDNSHRHRRLRTHHSTFHIPFSIPASREHRSMSPGPRKRGRVVLFKTPNERDTYDLDLRGEGYEPTFIPSLSEEYDVKELVGMLRGGGEWEGVVITSRRGAEGWVRAVKAALDPERPDGTDDGQVQGNGGFLSSYIASTVRVLISTVKADWTDIPLWTVGQTSIDHLEQSRESLDPRCSVFFPSISSERMAKSASELIPSLLDEAARHVLPPPHPKISTSSTPPGSAAREDGQNASAESGGNSQKGHYRPYLIVRGDKSLEEIPKALINAGRVVHPVEVYTTASHPDLPELISRTLGSAIPNGGEDEAEAVWLAFFSPSSAQFALERISPDFISRPRIRFFAIGETTRKYLIEAGIEIHAVADKPTSRGMLDAILASDASR